MKLLAITMYAIVHSTLLIGSDLQSPRTSMAIYMKRLSTHNLDIRSSQDNVSDGEQTERADDSPAREDNNLSQSDFDDALASYDERISNLENTINPPFFTLKSPYSASLFALLTHAAFWQETVQHSNLPDSHKQRAMNILSKIKENSVLNVAQTILSQHNAHNGWHFMAWCSTLDLIASAYAVNTAPVVEYFGNSISEHHIKLGLKGAAAWCLACLTRSVIESKAP